MDYYWVITAHVRRGRENKRSKWPIIDLHMDKLSHKELSNRLKSDYYGKTKWLSIDGSISMVHRLLDHNIDTEDVEGYHRKGIIIYGEEVIPVPIKVVTEYDLQRAWLRHEHDVIGKPRVFGRGHDDGEPMEVEESDKLEH